MDKLLTIKEIAVLLKVGKVTVQRWCKTGDLPAFKMGRDYRISEKDLEIWIEERKK